MTFFSIIVFDIFDGISVHISLMMIKKVMHINRLKFNAFFLNTDIWFAKNPTGIGKLIFRLVHLTFNMHP